MSRRRAVLPRLGNPMRPVLLLLAAAFGLMLVGFLVLMQVAGIGTAATIGVALLIVGVAVLCLVVVWVLAGMYEQDQAAVLAGDFWAVWQLTRDEHRRFVADERRRTRRLVATYGVGGSALGRPTRHEREILALLASWWTNREIADALCISYRTVTTRVGHIYGELGANSRRSATIVLLIAGE